EVARVDAQLFLGRERQRQLFTRRVRDLPDHEVGGRHEADPGGDKELGRGRVRVHVHPFFHPKIEFEDGRLARGHGELLRRRHRDVVVARNGRGGRAEGLRRGERGNREYDSKLERVSHFVSLFAGVSWVARAFWIFSSISLLLT